MAAKCIPTLKSFKPVPAGVSGARGLAGVKCETGFAPVQGDRLLGGRSAMCVAARRMREGVATVPAGCLRGKRAFANTRTVNTRRQKTQGKDK